MAERAESSDDEPTIAEDVVVTKYKMAGDMANRVLRQVLEAAVEGASVLSLCETGDRLILEETSRVYKKEKEMKKGIAFPTCISLNNCVCHFSPLRSDPAVNLANGDVLKIELGVHVDGFLAIVGHTTVVGATKESPVTGRKADVVQAAHVASEIAHRMVVPGGENMAVTDAIQKVCKSFNCNAVEGILSYQLKRNNFNTNKTIILNPNEQQSEVSSKFTVMPFSLRSCEEEGKARMGVVECMNHNLVEPFNVLYEKEGEFVAQFKFTVLLMPNGPLRITSGPMDPDLFSSSCSLDDPELKTLLTTSTSRKHKKKKKKTKPSEGQTEETEAAAEPPADS